MDAGPRLSHLAVTKGGPGTGRLGPARTLTGSGALNCIRIWRTCPDLRTKRPLRAKPAVSPRKLKISYQENNP